MYFYSAAHNKFYPLTLKDDYGESWPADAREVSDDCFHEFATANKVGYLRAPGIDGLPTWIPDPNHQLPTVHDFKATKQFDINQWRNSQELLPVEHNGHRWDADPTSRARIESVLLAGAMPLDYWTDADNTDRPMTLEQLRALYAAIVQQGGRIHDRQRQMKTEVAALTTIEDVQAYPVGWPIEEPA